MLKYVHVYCKPSPTLYHYVVFFSSLTQPKQQKHINPKFYFNAYFLMCVYNISGYNVSSINNA